MINRIATVAVYVANQQEAVKFWTEQVGMEVHRSMPMGPEANWIEVGPKGAQTCLVLYPKTMMPSWAEMKAAIVFETEDARLDYEAMKGRGVKFLDEPKSMPWGTFVQFVDPDGNQFLLKGKP